jgi:hypothetical protein
MITAASVQAAAEALALIQASGLPLQKFVEAMQANASYSTTLAMKIPKMIEPDFEPHFSVKHMLKDIRIATRLGLSQDLELAVTAAARDQLLEQIEQGHGDDDYSAVARKYLPKTEPAGSEETQTADEQVQTSAIIPVPETEEPKLEQENRNVAAGETTAPVLPGGDAKEETDSRRGFLRQLLRRARQLLKQPVSPKQG